MNPRVSAKASGTHPRGRAPVAAALKSPLGKKKMLISAVTLFFFSLFLT